MKPDLVHAPTTPTGKALLAYLNGDESGMVLIGVRRGDAILAIEAEARAQVEAERDAARDALALMNVLAQMTDAELTEGDPRYDWWWNVVRPVLTAIRDKYRLLAAHDALVKP